MMYHKKLNIKDCQDFFGNLQKTTAKKTADFRKLPSSDNGIYSDILKRDIFENAQIHKIKFPTSVLVTNTYLKHPATVVYVDRGKDTCTAVFGESFSYGDSMASPFRDVPIHWLLNASTMRHKIDGDVFKNMDMFEDVVNSKSMRVRYDNFSYRMKNNLGGHLTSELDTNYFFCCVPGEGMATILMNVQTFLPMIQHNNKKTNLFVQFTEPGRDWIGQQFIQKRLRKYKGSDFYEFLQTQEQLYFDFLDNLSEDNVDIYTWRNFTRWLGAEPKSSIKIEKVMLQVFQESLLDLGVDIPLDLGVTCAGWYEDIDLKRGITVPYLETLSDSLEFKQIALCEAEKYETSEKFMRHNENIFEGCGDYHPSTFGNKRYAEYLIENMRG